MSNPSITDHNQQEQAPEPARNPYENGNNPFLGQGQQDSTPPGAPVPPVAPYAQGEPGYQGQGQPQSQGYPQGQGQAPAPTAQQQPFAQPPAQAPSQPPMQAPYQNGWQQQPPSTQQTPLQGNRQQDTTPNLSPEQPDIPGFSKAVWFLGGFLIGLIGVIVVYLMNLGRPRSVRREVLRFALIGMLVGAVVDLIVLNMTGLNSGLAGQMPVFGGSAPTGTGGIF